jgi:hypothetical protein
MPREGGQGGAAEPPLAVRFEDLFDHVGTFDVRYGAAVRELSGCDIVIEGYLARPHGPHQLLSLVDQQGVCPDCSPVAAISLLGALAPVREGDDGLVRVSGRLDYGFRIDDGTASMLRIENAALQLVTT